MIDAEIPYRECAACGRATTDGLRWCSNSCFYAEDGYPDDYATDTEEEDDE